MKINEWLKTLPGEIVEPLLGSAALIGTAALIFAAYSVWYFATREPERGDALAVGMLLAWTLIPPCWFFAEEQVRVAEGKHPAEIQASQAAATKVWAGVLAALLLLYNA